MRQQQIDILSGAIKCFILILNERFDLKATFGLHQVNQSIQPQAEDIQFGDILGFTIENQRLLLPIIIFDIFMLLFGSLRLDE